MEMKNFILHGDILSVEVRIEKNDYIFGIQWKTPKKAYDDTWILKSYSNKLNGEKDLSKEKINAFLEKVNANWNWHIPE